MTDEELKKLEEEELKAAKKPGAKKKSLPLAQRARDPLRPHSWLLHEKMKYQRLREAF